MAYITPDFNTRGFFDRLPVDRDDDACSDCSEASCATADLHQADQTRKTRQLKATITTQEAKPAKLLSAADLLKNRRSKNAKIETPIAVAPTTDRDDDACSTCSWMTTDDFDDYSWRVARTEPVNLVEFTPITPYTPPVRITPAFAPTVPSVASLSTPEFSTCGTFDRNRDSDACSDCSFATADLFDEDMPRRHRKKSPKKALVAFTPVAPVVQKTVSPPWDEESLFASGHGSESVHVSMGDTTVMMHNVPCRRSPQFLFDKFAELGFTNDCMDYMYIPAREKGGRLTGTGYMFINLNTPEIAADFCEAVNASKIIDAGRISDAPAKAVFCSFADTQGVDACLTQFMQSKGKGLKNPAWLRRGGEWTPVFRD